MNRLKKLVASNKTLLFGYSIYVLFFAFFTTIFYKRIAAFGCFDDCFNYVGGYFLGKGESIYTDFFFNHSFLMPYISFYIQQIISPESIYALLLFHKLFLFGFSFLFGSFLIYRFKLPAALALIFYEGIKFYTFGDHFLGESFVVYPLMYLFGLVWEKLNGRKINKLEYLLTAFLSWFIIFSREPYAPVTLILFTLILFGKEHLKEKIISIIMFSSLFLVTFIFIPLKEMFLNTYLYNRGIIQHELNEKSINIFTVLFYPLLIFLKGDWNIFRHFQIFFSLGFLISGVYYTFRVKKLGFIVLYALIALANIRPITPGNIFYDAYHVNVVFGLLIFSTFLIIFELIKNKSKKIQLISLIPFFILGVYLISNPNLYIYDKVSQQEELNTNYANYFTYGNAIKLLSNSSSTMFLEERDDLIYLLADRKPSYKYYWYTAHMPIISKYKEARDEMFKVNPPDFYYDACLPYKQSGNSDLSNYTRLNINDKPSCLLIKNIVLNSITDKKWESVKPLGFSLPN